MNETAKTKSKNGGRAGAAAMAVVPESSGPVEVAASEAAAPADAEAAPAPEVPATPLILKIRTKAADTVVTSFASLRTAQSTAVQKTIAFLTTLDTKLAGALVKSETFLVGKLRIAE